MARSGLRTRLRAVCHRAISDGVEAIDIEARVQRGGVYVPCSINACPVTEPSAKDGLVLVVLRDRTPINGSIAVTTDSEGPSAINAGNVEVQRWSNCSKAN